MKENRHQKLKRVRKEQGMKQVSFWNSKEAVEALDNLSERFPKLTKDQLLSACILFTANASQEEIIFVCGLNQEEKNGE